MTNRLAWLAPLAWLGSVGSLACGTDDPAPAAPSGGIGGTPSGPSLGTGGTGNGAAANGSGPAPSTDCGARPVTSGEFSKRALLTAAADCSAWHYCQFDAAATRLSQAVEAHAADGAEPSLVEARAAWSEAMTAWARAELFQFGPAGSRALDPYHGRSFRDRIYAWPSVSRCRVEEQLVSQAYQQDLTSVLVSSKGLYALEYLLFYAGSDTACAPGSATGSGWAAIAPELAQRKRDYALAVARDVDALVGELRTLWDPQGGDFRQSFIDGVGYDKPGSDSDQEALNIVGWSLVYAEKEIKDYKVGPFTGKILPAAPIDGFEAPFAGLARDLVVANLEGVQSAFQGCGPEGEGIGFDDWLIAANHADLAAGLTSTLAAALAAVRAFPAFETASEAEFARLYDEGLKPFTDLLKNELLAGSGSPLNLSLPASAAADTD